MSYLPTFPFVLNYVDMHAVVLLRLLLLMAFLSLRLAGIARSVTVWVGCSSWTYGQVHRVYKCGVDHLPTFVCTGLIAVLSLPRSPGL